MGGPKKGELSGEKANGEGSASGEERAEEGPGEGSVIALPGAPDLTFLKPHPPKRTIVWVDEAGFYLLPMAVRTWAPIGVTPILEETAGRTHLSVIAGLTLEGRLITRMQEEAFKGEGIVRYLDYLMYQVPDPMIVLWDGGTIHRSEEVKAFLAAGAAERLHLEILPAYSPELNPVERVWQALKCIELRNVCCLDIEELRRELRKAIERLRHKADLLKSLACYLDTS